MKRLAISILAIIAVVSMGATTVHLYPACEKSPEQWANFVIAVLTEDKYATQFYMETGCGFLKGDMPVTVIERSEHWVRVRVKPEGHPPVIVYTSPEGIKE